jgi:hypothetical protein
MLQELRVYQCMPGRLPDLNRRFETITLKLWAKHGIRPTGFWTVAIGESHNDLYYLLGWESLAEREKKWSAFMADPDWIAAKAETEKNGQLIAHIKNYILTPTSYSPLK